MLKNRYTISRNIEKEMERQGLTCVEVARRSGLTDGTTSRYANGKISRGMSAECVRKIADALGVTCESLGMKEDE